MTTGYDFIPATWWLTQSSTIASSTNHWCSMATTKTSPPAWPLLRNPYVKDKNLWKPPSDSPPSPKIPSPGNQSVPPLFISVPADLLEFPSILPLSEPLPLEPTAPSRSPVTGTLLLSVVEPSIPSLASNSSDTINFGSIEAPSAFTLPIIYITTQCAWSESNWDQSAPMSIGACTNLIGFKWNPDIFWKNKRVVIFGWIAASSYRLNLYSEPHQMAYLVPKQCERK